MTPHRPAIAVVCGPLLAGLVCGCVLVAGGCARSAQRVSTARSQFQPAPTQPDIPKDRPPTAKTLYSMAQILATQGKDSQCEFVLRRCVQEYPQFPPAYNSLAELQMRQGRIHEAVDTLSTALRMRPHDPVLQNNLGMCLLLRQEYAPALEHFTAAAGRVPESEKYRANMAAALGLLGRQEESLALLQQILPPAKAKHNAQILHQAHERKPPPDPEPPPA